MSRSGSAGSVFGSNRPSSARYSTGVHDGLTAGPKLGKSLPPAQSTPQRTNDDLEAGVGSGIVASFGMALFCCVKLFRWKCRHVRR